MCEETTQPAPERHALEAQYENMRLGYKAASGYLDRFRDVLADALGFADENPGDDVLIATLREHFGRTGPEPTRGRFHDKCLCGLVWYGEGHVEHQARMLNDVLAGREAAAGAAVARARALADEWERRARRGRDDSEAGFVRRKQMREGAAALRRALDGAGDEKETNR